MKKYPFSNKAIKAILAASIALSPVVTTGIGFEGDRVEAASTAKADLALERMEKIYDKLDTEALKSFNNAAAIMKDWDDESLWNSFFPGNAVIAKQSLDGTGLTPAGVTSELAIMIHEANNTNKKLSFQLEAFRETDSTLTDVLELKHSNSFADTVLMFLADAEAELRSEDTQRAILREFLKTGSMSTTIENISKQVHEDLVSDPAHPEYVELNRQLHSKLGFGIDGLLSMKDKIYLELEKTKDFSGADIKNIKTGFITATLALWDEEESEDDEDNDPPSNPGPTVPPVTPPTPPAEPKPGEVTLPEGAAEVVREKNPSGKIEVTTKIPSDKVKDIVDVITEDKNIVPVKLEKAVPGEVVKASVPATLFSQAAAKNAKAIVEVQTEEASYKLPAQEIKVADLAKKLGVKEDEVQITVSVNVVEEKDVEDTVGKNKLKLASKVIEFTVVAVAGDKKESVSVFSVYVDRDIVGEEEFDAGNSVAVKLNEDGTFSSIPTLFTGKTATIKSLTNSKYTIVENDITFPDVNNKNWAEDYIETLASKYIIQGKETGMYAPGDQMTRAQFTLLLVRALGLPAVEYDNRFTDVKGNEWFNTNGELMAAVAYGIITGKEDGRFAPNDKITRSQAAVMIDRAMNISFLNYDTSQLDKKKKVEDFKDSKKVGAWAKDSIEAVYQAGIVSGKEDGTFDPNGFTKRDQMAKILGNFLISAKLMNDTINNK
ncbi:S-layer homology domain-containing protein [Cytobacillus oceanisediminis]|uniref:S-layer homology domain-containing protein n=1 Tax=Cytobacillus oceanisediminis TaxID=665099 RepID=UPI0037357A23